MTSFDTGKALSRDVNGIPETNPPVHNWCQVWEPVQLVSGVGWDGIPSSAHIAVMVWDETTGFNGNVYVR